MLILAGVSLNAIVGDNGIITNAQRTKYLQSCAALQEFFNEYYVSNYDKFEDTLEPILELEGDPYAMQWFYIPKNEGIGNLQYIVDSDGNCFFLIKKSSLPEKLKKEIFGGDANDKSYQSYASLIDVYGITNNFKVYYCINDKEFIGLESKNLLDKDNPQREVFSKTNNNVLYELLSNYDQKDELGNNDGILTVEEAKNITEINLNSDISVGTLRDLASLPNLTELTLDNIALDSLDGIENLLKLNKLYIINYQTDAERIKDYSGLKKANKIVELTIQGSSNNQLDKIFTAMSGQDYQLNMLKVYDSGANVTDISYISKLNNNTKLKIKELWINNNNISSIESISGFENVEKLYVHATLIKSLNGVKNLKKIKTLEAYNCKLGDDELFDTELEENGKKSETDALSDLQYITTLNVLTIYNNTNLKWLSYINLNTKLDRFSCTGNENMVKADVAKIKNIYGGLSNESKTYGFPAKYLALFNSEEAIDYKGYDTELTNDSDEIVALIDNTDVQYLRLDGQTNLGNNIEGTSTDLSDILKTCTSVRSLSLRGLGLLDNIDFVASMPNLTFLDIWDCPKITDLSILDTQTNAGKLHLYTFRINNPNADLTVCQKTLSGLDSDKREKYMYGEGGECYGFCASVEVYRNLNLCKSVNCIKIHYRKDYLDAQVDLSGCSSLTYFKSSHCKINFIFPSCLEELVLAHLSSRVLSDLSRCQALTKISLNEVFNLYPIDEWIMEIGKCLNIKAVVISTYECNKNLDFGYLKDCLYLTNFTLSSFSSSVASGTSTISNLDKASSIIEFYMRGINISNRDFTLPANCERVTFAECKLIDIPIIPEGITSLEKLDLRNNNIASLKRVEGINCIKDLRLENNLLEDNYSYKIGDTTYTKSTCQTILDLKNNGALTKIYLNNNNITDYSLLNLTGWNNSNKSGW